MLSVFIAVAVWFEPVVRPIATKHHLSELTGFASADFSVASSVTLPNGLLILNPASDVYQQLTPITETTLSYSGEKWLYAESDSLIVMEKEGAMLEDVSFFRRMTLVVLTFFYLVMVVVHWYNVRRIKKALRPFRVQALAYAEGDFSTRIKNEATLTSEFALSFNRMARQLDQRMVQLDQRNQIFNHVLNAMSDGVLAVNVDKAILVSNNQAERVMCLFHDDAAEPTSIPSAFSPLIDRARDDNNLIKHTVVKHGRHYAMVFSPLVKKDQVIGVVVLLRDVTEEVQLNELRELFVANVSHELRTPISLLQGYSEAIVDGVAETKEDQQELAQVILDESERMGRLVNDLLDLAKIKSGHIELNKEWYPVNEFVKRITGKFAHKARETDVQVESDVEPYIGALLFDYDRLEQVFTNLIDNALRYTESGKITVRVSKQTKMITFDVIDTGAGMDAANLPFLFERFYKADKARTRNKTGTGLGLAIAKEMVEAHAGTISVKSEVGQGTTFTITLPIIDE
ncbi:HAMP domain-containing sensor histidine kinase [Halolactibacillus halophilus]|nr:ATP-binding protein [Halolactibacillus halophilus]